MLASHAFGKFFACNGIQRAPRMKYIDYDTPVLETKTPITVA